MNRILSLALLGAGIVLIVLGISESNSVSSGISRFFTGLPTDRSTWMIAGGVMGVLVGMMGLTRLLRRKQD